jgi:hypothetical protein
MSCVEGVCIGRVCVEGVSVEKSVKNGYDIINRNNKV